MRKTIALFLVLSLSLGLFSGCSQKIDNSAYVPTGDAILLEGQEPEDILPEEQEPQELNLAYYPERSLNPLFGSDYINRILMSLMYQGLFAVDNQKNTTPILCGEYQISTSGRTWTVYLDEYATFSDGTKVTPQDVVACYWQAKENDYYKNRLRHLTNIEVAEDGRGILFQSDTPYENMALILDIPIVKESEVGLESPNVPLGTGPYVFHADSSGYVLQRNQNWWCDVALTAQRDREAIAAGREPGKEMARVSIPATDEIIRLVEVESGADVRDAFQFGGSNALSVVCTNPMSASFAEYRCDYELWEIESGYFLYIGCNILYSDFFDDSTGLKGGIRTFLTYGIDRETIIGDVYNGMVDTVTLPCSPEESYYSSSLARQYGYDPLKFIGSLSRFSIPRKDGKQKELQLLVNSDDSARVTIARNIAEDLTEMGLPCKTVEYTSGTFQSQVANGNFDIYLGMTRLSATMDLSEFFRPWGEMGRGGLAHESIYDMCKNALESSSTFYNLYKLLAEDGRIVPVAFGHYNVYAQRGLMPDLAPARDNVFYYPLSKTMDSCRREIGVE